MLLKLRTFLKFEYIFQLWLAVFGREYALLDIAGGVTFLEQNM